LLEGGLEIAKKFSDGCFQVGLPHKRFPDEDGRDLVFL
jgi:hypothetical protein